MALQVHILTLVQPIDIFFQHLIAHFVDSYQNYGNKMACEQTDPVLYKEMSVIFIVFEQKDSRYSLKQSFEGEGPNSAQSK